MSVAERLAKHPRWEWRAPMLHSCGTRGLTCRGLSIEPCVPNLTDAATAGILHAMLCEAWTRGGVDTSSNADGHEVSLYVARIRTGHEGACHRFLRRECLGEALGAALLWAWSL